MATYSRVGNNPNPSGGQNMGFYNRILRNLSKYGMTWDDDRIKNTYSIGPQEDTSDLIYQPGTNMYDLFTKKVIARILEQKSVAYLDRTYFDKRKILRQYSIKDEIKEYITQIADESVMYDEDNHFCNIRNLPDNFNTEIRQRYRDNFDRMMNDFRLFDGTTAWSYFKNLLIDGYISYEIVYDRKQKNVIDISPIDPITLIIATDPGTNTIIWIQHPDNPQLRRVLLDSQIIYISYSNNNEYFETSYVENLIRPYNQLKMLEQTKILYNINQASIYKKFVIPTNGLTRQQAEQQITQLMSEYHEDVQWDDQMGTMTINGSQNIPLSKDIWLPGGGEGGPPEINIETPGGIDLNEDMMLGWFYKKLKRATKIPFSRFDEDSGGGNVYNDASDITRDEIKFKNFINRLRTIFKELIIKPLKIQMILDFPELKDDYLLKNSIEVDFNTNELFEEWKYLNNLSKRSDIASALNANLMDAEGQPFFDVEWLVRNIMKLTDEEIEENNKYKIMRQNQQGGEGGPEGGGGGGDFGGGDFGGGGDDFGGGDFGGGGDDFGGGGDDFGGGGDDFGGGGDDFGGGQSQGGGQPQGGGGQMQF